MQHFLLQRVLLFIGQPCALQHHAVVYHAIEIIGVTHRDRQKIIPSVTVTDKDFRLSGLQRTDKELAPFATSLQHLVVANLQTEIPVTTLYKVHTVGRFKSPQRDTRVFVIENFIRVFIRQLDTWNAVVFIRACSQSDRQHRQAQQDKRNLFFHVEIFFRKRKDLWRKNEMFPKDSSGI